MADFCTKSFACFLPIHINIITKQSLNEKENILSNMSGHQNRKQKLAYLERIREENTTLANEKSAYQFKCTKLESKVKILEENVRYLKLDKKKPVNLFSK